MPTLFGSRIAMIALALVFGALCAVGGAVVYHYGSKRLERKSIIHNAQPMTVSIRTAKKHTCSKLSPEIAVQQIPPAARRLRVQIQDLNNLFNHQGGTVDVPSDGVIKEGALAGYLGPCPGRSGDHTYRYRVNALDEQGMVVGIAEVSPPCCSKVPESP